MENCNLKYYKKFCNEIFKKIKSYRKDLKKYFNNSLKFCDSLNKEIQYYLLELSKIDNSILYDPNKLKDIDSYKKIKKKYALFNEQIIKNNNLYDKIGEEYEKIIYFNFFPEDENAFDFYIKSNLIKENDIFSEANTRKSISKKFYGSKENLNNTNLENDINNYKCSKCGKNNANMIYQKKNELFCKDCYNYLENKIEGKEIDDSNKDQADRAYFLNSMINLIKFIILKCNKILEIKKDKSKIKKKVEYSKIENIQNDYFNFLVDINEKTNEEVNINDFNLTNLDSNIKQKIGELFKRNVDIKINLEEEDNDSNSNDNGEYVDEIFYYDSEHSKEKVKRKEKEKSKDKAEPDDKILNDFYYFINIIPKNNSNFNENIKMNFESKLKIKINPNNYIVSNNNKYFIDNLVRKDDFLKLSLEKIKNLYPNLEDLHEYKNIFDYLINECGMKDNIDCKGNFILKINNKGKTKEKYYPPYEWIGIGLKIGDKNDSLNLNYNDNEWAIAYYGVGGRLPINKVKDKLKDKIKDGLGQSKSLTEWNMDDIRHPGKKIGVGVYLTPNINSVEKFCGIISLNKERYRVALMVKVKIDKIREPKDINFWILNFKYIKPYRILLKKINKYHLN